MKTHKVIHLVTLGFMGAASLLLIYRAEYERAYALLGMMGFYAFGYKNGNKDAATTS